MNIKEENQFYETLIFYRIENIPTLVSSNFYLNYKSYFGSFISKISMYFYNSVKQRLSFLLLKFNRKGCLLLSPSHSHTKFFPLARTWQIFSAIIKIESVNSESLSSCLLVVSYINMNVNMMNVENKQN